MSISVTLRGKERRNEGEDDFPPEGGRACWDTPGCLGKAVGGFRRSAERREGVTSRRRFRFRCRQWLSCCGNAVAWRGVPASGSAGVLELAWVRPSQPR